MKNPFHHFNSSPEVIRLAVMMYIRYPLSLRQVEDLLFSFARWRSLVPWGPGFFFAATIEQGEAPDTGESRGFGFLWGNLGDGRARPSPMR